MRIIHTSDWHLGATLDHEPREEEHARFLEWLISTLQSRKTEVLLISGDLFHHAQPSAKALAQYYGFLSEASAIASLKRVIVIGGNHDSAARLDAAAPILSALKVHVVGSVTTDPESWERCLCPVEGPDGEVEAVVAAVPFVHEFKLGVRTTAREGAEVRAELQEVFTKIYSTLADKALERWPGARLVAMGHLTCGNKSLHACPLPIHQAGLVGGLSPKIFDARYDYVGLGHIHASFPVETGRVWYSGGPIPINITEARHPNYLLELGLNETLGEEVHPLDAEGWSLLPIEIPIWRELREVKGTLKEVVKTLKKLKWQEELPPYLYVDVEVEGFRAGVEEKLRKALTGFLVTLRPKIVRWRQVLTTPEDEEVREKVDTPSLRELSPEEVFVRFFRQRHDVPPDQEVLQAFKTLVHEVEPSE